MFVEILKWIITIALLIGTIVAFVFSFELLASLREIPSKEKEKRKEIYKILPLSIFFVIAYCIGTVLLIRG